MSLPIISVPEFTCTLPSTGQAITYRPFLVKEEKILLMAAEDKSLQTIAQAVKRILQACILTPGVQVDKLPFFDVEYLFLMLRAKSVGEKIKLAYRHKDGLNLDGKECKQVTECEVDIEALPVPKPPKDACLIPLPNNMVLQLRYPSLDEILATQTSDDGKVDPEKVFTMLAKCIVGVFQGDTLLTADSLEEAQKFVEQLQHTYAEKLNRFFSSMPTVETTFTYTCKGCGQADTVTLKGLHDFF